MTLGGPQVFVRIGYHVSRVVPAKVRAEQSCDLNIVGNDVDTRRFETCLVHLITKEAGIASNIKVGGICIREALACTYVLDELVALWGILPDYAPATALRQLDGLIGSTLLQDGARCGEVGR